MVQAEVLLYKMISSLKKAKKSDKNKIKLEIWITFCSWINNKNLNIREVDVF